VLQCFAVCCSALQCVAVCCSVLQCLVVCCSVLQCLAMCHRLLQCVVACCSVLWCSASTREIGKNRGAVYHSVLSILQRVAAYCNVLQFSATQKYPRNRPRLRNNTLKDPQGRSAVCHSLLQCVAVCCSVLQCVASVLQCCSCDKRQKENTCKKGRDFAEKRD